MIIIALFCFTKAGFRLSLGTSTDAGIYWVKKVDHEKDKPELGAKYIVNWTWDKEGLRRGLHSRKMPMIKEVGGLPGDAVWSRFNGQVYVNNNPVPGCVIAWNQITQKSLPVATPFEVGPDEVCLVSHSLAGWDSRYFGPVPWSELTHRAYPVFIWRKVEN